MPPPLGLCVFSTRVVPIYIHTVLHIVLMLNFFSEWNLYVYRPFSPSIPILKCEETLSENSPMNEPRDIVCRPTRCPSQRTLCRVWSTLGSHSAYMETDGNQLTEDETLYKTCVRRVRDHDAHDAYILRNTSTTTPAATIACPPWAAYTNIHSTSTRQTSSELCDARYYSPSSFCSTITLPSHNRQRAPAVASLATSVRLYVHNHTAQRYSGVAWDACEMYFDKIILRMCHK